MRTLTVETEFIQPLAQVGARAIAGIWTQLICQAMLNAATPVQAGALNLADQERIRQEAERAVQLAAE